MLYGIERRIRLLFHSFLKSLINLGTLMFHKSKNYAYLLLILHRAIYSIVYFDNKQSAIVILFHCDLRVFLQGNENYAKYFLS